MSAENTTTPWTVENENVYSFEDRLYIAFRAAGFDNLIRFGDFVDVRRAYEVLTPLVAKGAELMHLSDDEWKDRLPEFVAGLCDAANGFLSVACSKAALVELTEFCMTNQGRNRELPRKDWILQGFDQAVGLGLLEEWDNGWRRRATPAGTIQGVTLIRVALLLESDFEKAKQLRKKWQNKKSPSLPDPIGWNLEHSQETIYEPSAIAEFLEMIGEPMKNGKSSFVRTLHGCCVSGTKEKQGK